MKISILTSYYKNIKYLSYFLNNLDKQTIFDKIEIIIDHNKPTKQEIKLIKKFQQQYPNKLVHLISKKVVPYGVSINRCINASRGSYLAIWNIDDARTPNSLELQYNAIKNKKVSFVYGNFKIVKELGSISGKEVDVGRYDENELLISMIIGPFFMFRKNICNKIGYYDEQLISGSDFDFAIKMALVSKGKKILNNLGYYLNAEKGLSTKKNTTQGIESSLIYLRYGIFEKFNHNSIFEIMKYEIKSTKYQNKYIPMNKYFKNYNAFIVKKLLYHNKNISFSKKLNNSLKIIKRKLQ